MELNNQYVFQSDSVIVNDIYNYKSNYIIEEGISSSEDKYCCIYFSSNDIYFPNNEETFIKRIVEKNNFEWYSTRLEKACKHIFIRDIKKQWYLSGINTEISSPELLLEFLKDQTKGFNVITLGSSAGGYAAVLYGSLLNAKYVLSFNGQFELNSLLESSNPTIDPLLFRVQNSNLRKYYDLKNFINNDVRVYYFYSNGSVWDISQYKHIANESNVFSLSFITSHHGIPFLKCNLKKVINMSSNELDLLKENKIHPFIFSLQMVGLIKTIQGISKQVFIKLKKLF